MGDAAEIARRLEMKYKDYGKEIDIDLDAEGRSDIAQQSFLPSVIDPKLWLVRCKVGVPFFFSLPSSILWFDTSISSSLSLALSLFSLVKRGR